MFRARIVYFMWDLDRRREKLKGLASRLEQIASGNAKERVRSLRRLSVSAFSSGRIIDGLVREIEILERENGIELSKESRNPSLEGALEASGVRRLIDPSGD